ncbi:chloride channel protein [Methanolacinia petrolearia]|uniref:chloride channel protein n=1 Tax=Methanolacinia petrolearia TaxID=54120 RepID=UPI003BABE5EB
MDGIVNYTFPREGQIAGWTPPINIWLILPAISFGALLSGILVYTFAPEAEGHGTDAAIRAFHKEGRIRPRVVIVKAVSSILTISTGGSAGREGPTAQISAGFGSVMSDVFKLSEHERRIAIATGIGAGIATIFKAPLGGALLAAEILYYRDFESEAVVPAFLASIIGYSIFGYFEGYDPIFSGAKISWNVTQIPFFLVLGVFCSAFGLLYIKTFYSTRDLFLGFFTKHNIPNHFKPLAGAVIIGLLVIALAHISHDTMIAALGGLGAGYGFIQLSLYNMLPLTVLLLLPFIKIITTSLTIGSGGSGGVFAPGLVIGGAVGGALGMLFHFFIPEIIPLATVPAFVIVGMISLFGGISNAPIAVMIMVVEMSGDFSLLVPAMGAVAISTILTGDSTIFREQVPTKAQSGAHRGEYNVEILEEIPAREAMTKKEDLICISPSDSAKEVIKIMDESLHTGFPVIENGKLVGIVTLRNIRKEMDNSEDVEIEEIMVRELVTINSSSSLEKALSVMMSNAIHHLPVVDDNDPEKLEGFITSTDIMRAYTKRMNQ